MPFMTQITLECPTDSLVLDAFAGWGITGLDLGEAVVREVSQEIPDEDGEFDFTALTGGRNITIGLELVELEDTIWNMNLRLRKFGQVRYPVTMRLQLTEDAPVLWTPVRRSQFSSKIEDLTVSRQTLQFFARDGYFYSAEPTVTSINPNTSGVEIGRSYDLSFDRTYPASPVLGSASVNNAGNVPVAPLVRFYGPCTDPALINDTIGKGIYFSGLTVNAGEFLEVNMAGTANSIDINERYSPRVLP